MSLRDHLTCYMPLVVDDNILVGVGASLALRAATGTFVDPVTDLVTPAAVNVARFEAEGRLIEGPSTNEALHSRDFTNSVHVKVNLAAAKDAVGADGMASAASTLTATSANGTVFQNITKASEENTYSIDIRRKTGSGVIEISDDGGASFFDITSSINASTYSRFQITTTQANPTIGLRVASAGDKIEVDYQGLESLPFASSRIPTTTVAVSRSGDALLIDPSNIPAPTADYSISIRLSTMGSLSSDMTVYNVMGETQRAIRIVPSQVSRFNHGSSGPASSVLSLNTLTVIVGTKSASTLTQYIDGVTDGTGSPTAVSGSAGSIEIGSQSFADQLYGHIKEFRIYDKELTQAEVLEDLDFHLAVNGGWPLGLMGFG